MTKRRNARDRLYRFTRGRRWHADPQLPARRMTQRLRRTRTPQLIRRGWRADPCVRAGPASNEQLSVRRKSDWRLLLPVVAPHAGVGGEGIPVSYHGRLTGSVDPVVVARAGASPQFVGASRQKSGVSRRR